MIEKINETNPDIVLFTGDLIAKNKKMNQKKIDFLIKELNKIKATSDIYAIKGDKDYNKIYNNVINKTHIKVINNSYELVYYKGNIPILLTGSGSILHDDCDLGQTFSYNGMDNLYTISMIHEPNIAETINNRYKSDLIVAGHNLNGQIRLPIIGGLMKAKEGGKYLNKKYNLSRSKLYVSNGIGTEKYELRLFNRPSINFYRITRKEK